MEIVSLNIQLLYNFIINNIIGMKYLIQIFLKVLAG